MMPHSPQPPYQGSCLCGAIQFEAGEFSPIMAHCHCRMCRKFHGAAYATFASTPSDQFRWLKGAELLASYQAGNGTIRKFCRQCGSSLIFVDPTQTDDMVEFALATLDEPVNAKPDAHIYTAYKAEWTEICDGLPTYPEGREDG